MDDQAYAIKIKEILKECISELDSIKSLYLLNPEKDFTRKRKISFEEFVNICLKMNGGKLQNELNEYFNFSDDTPTKSAYCQQRGKVSSEALKYLYFTFTDMIMKAEMPRTFKGFRLLACDGSDINLPYNPLDMETFQQNKNKRGYNQIHLNAFFDILNGIYVDCVLEPDSKSHERQAFLTMADRYRLDEPSIIIADRGYEGYNSFVHLIESGQKFIIRLKEAESNGIISTYAFSYDENGEFDTYIQTTLTWRQTNEVKSNKDKYTYVARDHLDYYSQHNVDEYSLRMRVVCINVAPGKYEYLATNLDKEEFDIGVMKTLYHYRWNEENSFRDLKYTIDLVHFHAKKRNYVEQEIWARLVVYNFCQTITFHIADSLNDRKTKNTKYDYKVNFSTAANILKHFLKEKEPTYNPCRLIRRFLIPIRPGRSFERKVKPQSAKYFIYRAS